MKKNLKKIMSVVISAALVSAFTVSAFAFTPEKGILVAGDSIATGYGLDDRMTECYASMLGSALDVPCDNVAVDGLTSDELEMTLKNVDMTAYDTFIISIGGNDLIGNILSVVLNAVGLTDSNTLLDVQAALVADPDAMTKIADAITEKQDDFGGVIDTIANNVLNTAAIIKTANEDAKIYVQTLYNLFSGVPSIEDFSGVAGSVIGSMNDLIKLGAKDSGLYEIIDVAEHFEGKALLLTNILKADIHPNKAGHDVIFNTAYTAITGEVYEEADETAENNETTEENETVAESNEVVESDEDSDENEEVDENITTEKSSPDTGAESVLITGALLMIAGGAVLFSRKKSN